MEHDVRPKPLTKPVSFGPFRACVLIQSACFTQGKEYGTRCETEATDETGLVRTVQGVCVDSICVFTIDTVECENP